MTTLTTPEELERLEELSRRASNASTWLWLHGHERGTAQYTRTEADWAALVAEMAAITGTPVPLNDTCEV